MPVLSVKTAIKLIFAFLLPLVTANPKHFVLYQYAPVTAIKAGESADLVLTFNVKPGFHIQADQLEDPYLLPTRIDLDLLDGFAIKGIHFPDSKTFRLTDNQALQVFDGTFQVRISIETSATLREGSYEITGTLFYQTCDHRRCFFPRTLSFKVPVRVESRGDSFPTDRQKTTDPLSFFH